jgi:hypothetical protein
VTVVSWIALGLALTCAVAIAADVFVRGYRQRMRVMEAVWVVSALYLAPLAVLGYARYGRPSSRRWLAEHGRDEPPEKPNWATVAVGVSHCGAGCTLGDIVAEFTVFAFGLTLFGTTLAAELAGDYVLAVALGLVFQYFAIAPMRGLGVRDGLVAAAKADVLSLTAFEVGLFGWMVLMSLVFYPAPHHLHPDSPVYWFLMQVGMAIGFVTAYPANAWLIRRGIKEAM